MRFIYCDTHERVKANTSKWYNMSKENLVIAYKGACAMREGIHSIVYAKCDVCVNVVRLEK